MLNIDFSGTATRQMHRSALHVAAEIQRAVLFLSRESGVKRIWLFGSAAKGRALDAVSDLDFATEGLGSFEMCRVWSELDSTLEIPLDLVRMETASAALRRQILQWGKLVYER